MKLCLYSIWPFVIRNGDYSCQKRVICEEMFASAGLKPRLETEWEKGTNWLILPQAPQT